MRFVDLSIFLENDVVSDPHLARPRITYLGHDATIDRMRSFFPDLTADHLPDGQAWAIEKVELTTHNGTHLDAPYHFHPTMNHAVTKGGERASTIDEIPLDWCYRPAVKLDFRHFEDGYIVTARDIETELDRIGYSLKPFDIVLVNTRAGEAYGTDSYVSSGCGIGREATLYLLEAGVRITGTDAWSWDVPFQFTAERVARSGNYGLIWEGHKAGRERAYCHLEKLHQLERLPATGFKVACFPVKIRGGSAGWTRAVAVFED